MGMIGRELAPAERGRSCYRRKRRFSPKTALPRLAFLQNPWLDKGTV
jgi:hypothetical protein